MTVRKGSERRIILPAAAIAVVYLIISISLAISKRPWFDEAAFANPALSLVTRGSMGMTISEPLGWNSVPGKSMVRVQQHVYYSMPLSHLGLAAWFKVVGFGVLRMRLYHILWGLAGLAAWIYIVRVLMESWTPALLAGLLIAMDRTFVDAASSGRPDMLSAALASLGIAAYLALRERHLSAAIFCSQAFMATAMFTHPIGALADSLIVILVLRFDLRRLRWHYLFLAAAPFVVGFGLWGLYISRDPEAFRAQFAVNAAGRAGALTSPLQGLIREVRVRFGTSLYLPAYATGVRRVTILIPVLFALGVIGALFQRQGARMLGILGAAYFFVFGFLEGHKQPFYLIHLTPLALCCLAAWAWSEWNEGLPARKWAAASAVVLMLLLQSTWIATAWWQNTNRRAYVPAMAFLDTHATPSSVIIGSSELGFHFGFFNKNVIDDSTLGYYSGKRADFIVLDENGYREAFKGYPVKDPGLDRYVHKVTTEDYQQVYAGPVYTIYRRN